MFMFGSSPPSLSGSASSPKTKVAMQTLKSRAWSCSELTRGAAQVVDTMESPHAEVLRVQRECLQMTSGMTMEDIQQALKVECGVCEMSCCDEDMEKAIDNHPCAAQIDDVVGAPTVH